MAELLVVADDFTGALDTGIQFAQQGIETRVFYREFRGAVNPDCKTPVVVIDSETRHLRAEDACEAVKEIVHAAASSGIRYIYKKTDSALRGCVGAELAGAVYGASEVSGGPVDMIFAPAYPRMKRTTENGVQYIESVPVSESVFGRDPFEPVTHSDISEIIGSHEGIEKTCLKAGEEISCALSGKSGRIIICDAANDDDLRKIAARAAHGKGLRLLAGCAGLASFLPETIDFPVGERGKIKKTNNFFVICGSLNPISETQVRYAEDNGFRRFTLTNEQKTSENYVHSAKGSDFVSNLAGICGGGVPVVVDVFSGTYSSGGERAKIADELGRLTCAMVESCDDCTVVIIGGDTLAGFIRNTGCREINPVCELFDGVVCSTVSYRGNDVQLVSKSGGFGKETVLADIAKQIINAEAHKR